MKLDPILDMKTGEQAVEYGQQIKPHPLVSELWAIRGNCGDGTLGTVLINRN